MKIATYGAKHFLGQLPRIDEAFKLLGHDVVGDKSDLIYANDPSGFNQAIHHKQEFGGVLMLNILDIPFHLPDFKQYITIWQEQLKQADIITSISHTTAKYVKRYTGFNSYVIYNPIRNIYPNKHKIRKNFFISVGRLADPNKRFDLAIEITKKMGQKIHTFGSDTNPNFENEYYKGYGVVNDEQLCEAYSSSRYYLCMSNNEGLCLPVFEASVCGCVPVINCFMETAEEFWPSDFLVNPNNIDHIIKVIYDMDLNYLKYSHLAESFGSLYRHKLSPGSVAKNILNLL